jgi:hypothetical protein
MAVVVRHQTLQLLLQEFQEQRTQAVVAVVAEEDQPIKALV